MSEDTEATVDMLIDCVDRSDFESMSELQRTFPGRRIVTEENKGAVCAVGSRYPDPPWDPSTPFYHGTEASEWAENIVNHGIDMRRTQSRDRGFYGEGFYVAARPDTAMDYGDHVVEVHIDPEANALWGGETFPERVGVKPEGRPSFHDDFMDWHIGTVEAAAVWEQVPDTTRQEVLDSARRSMDPMLSEEEGFDRMNWYPKVTQWANATGFDVVVWTAGEIIITNTDVVTSRRIYDGPRFPDEPR